MEQVTVQRVVIDRAWFGGGCEASAMEERGKIQATKEEMAKLKADTIKWLIGTKLALAVLIIYLVQ